MEIVDGKLSWEEAVPLGIKLGTRDLQPTLLRKKRQPRNTRSNKEGRDHR